MSALVGIAAIFALSSFLPDSFREDLGPQSRLDPCVTGQAVLKNLDGGTVQRFGTLDEVATVLETITIHRDRVSSLKIESDGAGSINVRFLLDHRGKRVPIEGTMALSYAQGGCPGHQLSGFGGHVVEDR